jgi:FkbM family methyltransferase
MFSKFLVRIVALVRRVYFWQKRRRYERFGKGHVFDINVSENSFVMTFLDYSLDQAIIERIEGRRERETAAIIQTLLPAGANVLEIGACYGYFTNIMASCVGPTGRVVSLDGDSDAFRVLSKNLELNDLNNVVAYKVLVTSPSANTTSGNSPSGIGPAHVGDDVAQDEPATVILSDFLEQIEFRPDYLFMDIEGFEVDVFEDLAREYLGKYRPVIVFEMHPQFYNPGKTAEYIKELLEGFGYRHRVVAENLVCIPE